VEVTLAYTESRSQCHLPLSTNPTFTDTTTLCLKNTCCINYVPHCTLRVPIHAFDTREKRSISTTRNTTTT